MIAPLRGSAARRMRASKRSSIGRAWSLARSSRRLRRAANFFTRRCLRRLFSIALFFAIHRLRFPRLSAKPGSLPEGEVKRLQQGLRFRVGLRCRADHDVETQLGLGLVVVDFGKNDVLLDAKRIIAPSVERLWIEAAEIAHARQRDRHQTIEKLVHPRPA